MKKVITLIFSIVLITNLFCYVNDYDLNPDTNSYTKYEIDLKISFDKIAYNSNEDTLMIYIFIKNKTDRKLYISVPLVEYYNGSFKLKDKNINSPLKFNFWDRPSKYMDCGPGFPATLAIELAPNEVFNKYKFNIVQAYNMQDITTSTIMKLFGEYPAFTYKESKPGVLKGKITGEIDSNVIRLFVNMENELIDSDIQVEPHKWNVNWEDHPNSGVLTLFLGNIKGYSVKAIKKDTVLYNGTLKPAKIQIIGSHNDMKGKVLMMKFKKSDCVEFLGMLKTGETRKINISGQLKNNKWFYGETEVEIVGKKENK